MNRYLWYLVLCSLPLGAQPDRWVIDADQRGVRWNVAAEPRLPHADNVELSGRKVSGILYYAVDSNRRVSVLRKLIYPGFRTVIRDTDPAWWATYRNYLRADYTDADALPPVYVDDRRWVPGPVDSVRLDGFLTLYHAPRADGLAVVRRFFPDRYGAHFYEEIELRNYGADSLQLRTLPLNNRRLHLSARTGGVLGDYVRVAGRSTTLLPGATATVRITFGADAGEEGGDAARGAVSPRIARRSLLDTLTRHLRLETPEPVYNTLFNLSKIRGAESIFDSQLGLVHSPGGGRYYAGFWANDQAEYINPFFPYLGYALADSAALNMWRVYQRSIPTDGSNIRYSFEMHGEAPANPLDRGDAAMIAYGLSHYLLALGDPAVAAELQPLLDWCLDYNHRKLNAAGVVASQSDEMEGRIETGDANLATSALYYGALETSLSLAAEMDRPAAYRSALAARRAALAPAIEAHFGRTVEGLATYRYYAGHDRLRHWIALPLVVGLHDRAAGTLDGLFDRLWTDNGVHVEKNAADPAISRIFWDRGTLYALRGAFLAGGTERAHERLLAFSRRRLLGERVPYVVEAYPEGDMAHLSAESGLYCRIFTEGLFGLLPTGFRSFRLQPTMPDGWDRMALRGVRAFGQREGFDLEVEREASTGRLMVTVTAAGVNQPATYRVTPGETLEHTFR